MTHEVECCDGEDRDYREETVKNLENDVAAYARSAEKRPGTYLPKLGAAYYELGRTYLFEYQDDGLAEKMFLRSLDAYEKYKGRKRSVLFDRIHLLEDLITLYNRTEQLERSERMLLRLLEIDRKLAEEDWLVYSENVAIVQWRLGNLYAGMERWDSAERMYREALATRNEFDQEDPCRYYPGTAQCYRSLGMLYAMYLHDFPEAETCYLKSIGILQELGEDPYERCNCLRPLLRSVDLLADLYEEQGEKEKAARCRSEAEALVKEIESA